jgi:hypothetical protein
MMHFVSRPVQSQSSRDHRKRDSPSEIDHRLRRQWRKKSSGRATLSRQKHPGVRQYGPDAGSRRQEWDGRRCGRCKL